jgi:putative endonuclease
MEKLFTYILYSDKIDHYYIGSTDDLQWRLDRHNMGWGKYTKRGIPWELVYCEKFKTKTEALKREREIKRKKSRKYIEGLIHAGGRPE